jgi:pyruvate formate lyase activating enzyme
MDKGMIFDIQRFCLHDGEGIRTVVFMKGCPLRCKWCCNPESQSFERELLFDENLCIGCNSCKDICKYDVINKDSEVGIYIDRNKCISCGDCAAQCPSGALQISGEMISVETIIKKVMLDYVFYQMSGGGVTISGGEPLFQPYFLIKLLKALKKEGLNTALETCGMAPWENMKAAAELLDTILFDIKHIDRDKHIEGTGVDNDLIINNLKQLAKVKDCVIMRLPIIPEYNMNNEYYLQIAGLVIETGIKIIHLLPYHRLGQGKYRKLNREYDLEGLAPPLAAEVLKAKHLIEYQTSAKVIIMQ